MNPFLEPTVAKPQPGVRWHRDHSRGQKPAGVIPCRGPAPTDVPPARSDVRRSRSRRGAGKALRILALAGSLLLPTMVQAVDINTATVQQLQEVKGIGPKTAAIIIEERDRGGAFESMSDVSERVKGIGPKKAASLEAAGLKVGAAAASDGKGGDVAARTPRRNR